MDCYYHKSVPSVAVCHDCSQTICATCRDAEGLCPGCRLARRIDSASASRSSIGGGVGPAHPPPNPGPTHAPPPQQASRGSVTVIDRPAGPLVNVSPETRALLGLGYPLWPLAALALLDPKRDPAVRRASIQALALNGAAVVLTTVLGVIANFTPFIAWPAWVIIPFIFPVWLVATVIYGFRTWHGDDVRVPLISDWLDEREARREAHA